jgi:inosine-uridine nucleoside N-ribohydrolase
MEAIMSIKSMFIAVLLCGMSGNVCAAARQTVREYIEEIPRAAAKNNGAWIAKTYAAFKASQSSSHKHDLASFHDVLSKTTLSRKTCETMFDWFFENNQKKIMIDLCEACFKGNTFVIPIMTERKAIYESKIDEAQRKKKAELNQKESNQRKWKNAKRMWLLKMIKSARSFLQK